jgi:hypothetical protein
MEVMITVYVLMRAERTIAAPVASKINIKALRVDILPDGNGLLGRSLLSMLMSK